MHRFAIGIAARLAEFVAQINQPMAAECQVLIMERGFDRIENDMRLAATGGTRPNMKRERMIIGRREAAIAIAQCGLTEGHVGEDGWLGHVIMNAGRTQRRNHRDIGRELIEDRSLQGEG